MTRKCGYRDGDSETQIDRQTGDEAQAEDGKPKMARAEKVRKSIKDVWKREKVRQNRSREIVQRQKDREKRDR